MLIGYTAGLMGHDVPLLDKIEVERARPVVEQKRLNVTIAILSLALGQKLQPKDLGPLLVDIDLSLVVILLQFFDG